MPFKIVRNDITKMQVDAIVNTANEKPIYSSGTDFAIYMAAGENELLSDEQKADAINQMVEMTQIAEKENAAELMLESKGFSDVVVSMSEGSVDVIVNVSELTTPQMAQIEDIVKRKTGADASEIIINPVVKEP